MFGNGYGIYFVFIVESCFEFMLILIMYFFGFGCFLVVYVNYCVQGGVVELMGVIFIIDCCYQKVLRYFDFYFCRFKIKVMVCVIK